MKRVTYVDKEGRRFEKLIPDDAPDSHAKMGVHVGPPDLTPLGLNLATELRLNNQLHARGILTQKDAEQRLNEIAAALIAALRKDAMDILALYG